ncbi:MAG: hypothetical protein WD044_09150 [Dongiaceae bacterium]
MTRLVAVESVSDAAIAILSPEQGLADEMAMLQAVAEGRLSSASLIWSTHDCLVVPRLMESIAGFADARDAMARGGWPIHVRYTGGDIYPQGPGIVNLAIAFRLERGNFDRVGRAYAALCDPIVRGMQDLGIGAQCSLIDGAFCRGSHDIAIAGQKIAGVAQRWRRAASPFELSEAVLVHAGLLCAGDVERLSAAVNRFYRACALDRKADPASHTTLFGKRDATAVPRIARLVARIAHHLDRAPTTRSVELSAGLPYSATIAENEQPAPRQNLSPSL